MPAPRGPAAEVPLKYSSQFSAACGLCLLNMMDVVTCSPTYLISTPFRDNNRRHQTIKRTVPYKQKVVEQI